MNKFLRIILLFCIAFTLKSSAMQHKGLHPKLITLKTNLGSLKTKLTTLSEKLKVVKDKLAAKKQPITVDTTLASLNVYALYGDNPEIINAPGTTTPRTDNNLEKDKFGNLWFAERKNIPFTGYGYKTANLRVLKNMTGRLRKIYPGVKFDVPDFIGISSENVKKYLLSKNLNISQQWNTVTSAITEPDKKASLQSKNLPDSFITGIDKIEKVVKNTFIQAATKPTDLDNEFMTQGIKNFLSTAGAKNLKLMIRSTGKEDTDQLANAGGNETIGNVDPIAKNILTAMGQGPEDPINKGEFKLGVVSSYFGLKSFTQRIKAGDLSLYEEPPTPALIQVMIGETADEITSCGVMFTEEPEGGISQKKETYPDTDQIKTTGITRIECSYGHNEGVVNSMVPVDVYYIDNKKEINSIIRVKDKRIIPTPTGFQITTNYKRLDGNVSTDKDLPNKPALSKEEVKALKTLANYLEFHYKKPMDVEFVLKKANPTDKKRTIYLVQARPIVHNDKKITPSYILNTENFKEKVTGEVIGIAGGALRLVKNRDECVVAETLKEALEIYQKLSNTDNVNCIFVKNMAPATSHEATQFRTEQKAVMCVPEVQTIEKWLQENKMVLIDIQQELVTVWNGDPDLEEALKSDDRLHDGWINYPIPMKLTLDDLKDTKYNKKISTLTIEEINTKFKEFLTSDYFKDVATEAQKQAKKDFIKKKGPKRTVNLAMFRTCFNSIKKDNEESAKLNLYKLCPGVNSLINQMLKQLKDNDFTYQAKLILNHFLLHAKQVSSVLEIQPSANNYYKRLYEVRYLEAILFQTPSNDIFNNYSIETLLTRIYAKEKSIEKELRKTVPPTVTGEKFNLLVQYGKATEFILTDDLKKKWMELLTQLPNTDLKTDQKNFNTMFYNLAKNNLLTVWFLLSVEPVIKNKNITSKLEAHNIIDQLYSDYNKNKPFIDELKKQRDKFNELEISLWSNAHKFGKQKQNLEKIGAYFKNQAFFDAYNASGNLGKVFATQVMEEFITLFDTSIKQLESSLKEYPDEKTLITNIKALITLFLSFLDEWINKFPGAENIDGISGWGGQKYTQQKYDTVQVTLSGISPNFTTYNKQIKISLTFDVGASAIGGSKNIVENLTTLEDIFTFTHQSLLNILSFLNKQLTIGDVSLPPILTTLQQEIETEIKKVSCKFGSYQTNIVGWDKIPNTANFSSMYFERNKLIRKYNYPLRSHSMIVFLTFDATSKKAQVICEMSGENEYNRFTKIADYEDVTCKALNLKLEYKLETKRVTWTYEVAKDTPLDIITKIKYLILASSGMSFATDNYENAMKIEAEIYRKSLATNGEAESFLEIDQPQKQKLLDAILNYSYNGTRLHSVFVTALENLPQNATAYDNWSKTIEILGKLINEANQYRINSECFFFKKYFSPAFGSHHHILGNLNLGEPWYNLNANNYLTNMTIADMDVKRNYFKFREAKKIFNYLCQVSENFDENCWNKFLDLIKTNQEFVLTLQDLPLDNMEGYGPAAANLESAGTQGRTLKLQDSISKLFNNGFTSKISGVTGKAKETAENLITMGMTSGKPEWTTVKDLILSAYTPKFGTFSSAAVQATIMQSIKNTPDIFLAQANAEDTFKLVYPKKKVNLQTFIGSLGDFAMNPNDQISLGALKILTYLKSQGEDISTQFATISQKIKVDQDTLLHQQKITDLITLLYDLAPSQITFLAEVETIAKKAIKSSTFTIKSEAVKLAKFVLSKNAAAVFNSTDLIDLNEIKNNIDQFTFNDTPDKKGEKAIKELIAMGAANKATVQDPTLIDTIKNQIQKGYYFGNTQNPNVLELYELISQKIYTDPELIKTAKTDLMNVLDNTTVADNVVPNYPDQRNKIVNFAEYLIRNNNVDKSDVWAILQASGTGTKRKSLICIQILFKTQYGTKEFFDLSIPLIFSQINADDGANNYSKIANDCYATLDKSITQNKYSHPVRALLKTTLQSLALTPGSYPHLKQAEMNDLL